MRLLLTSLPGEGEPELRLEEFFGNHVPEYAILSHTWVVGKEEVIYSDIKNESYAAKEGLFKIRGAIERARCDGHKYIWIDAACIDKASSAELSEAINSMYRWYRNSQICYVYMVDVGTYESDQDAEFRESFCKSRWWSRGWTLQELIAPRKIEFFSSTWESFGDIFSLMQLVEKASGIKAKYLTSNSTVKKASIAKRMSWMRNRTTTREEDIAYCLLGLFSVNMPMLYGEGSEAFRRLQEEIIKNTDDNSIFAWQSRSCNTLHGMLADHPRDFAHSGGVKPVAGWHNRKPFFVTNMGLSIELLMPELDNGTTEEQTGNTTVVAAMACRNASRWPTNSTVGILAIRLRAVRGSGDQWIRVNCNLFWDVDESTLLKLTPRTVLVRDNINLRIRNKRDTSIRSWSGNYGSDDHIDSRGQAAGDKHVKKLLESRKLNTILQQLDTCGVEKEHWIKKNPHFTVSLPERGKLHGGGNWKRKLLTRISRSNKMNIGEINLAQSCLILNVHTIVRKSDPLMYDYKPVWSLIKSGYVKKLDDSHQPTWNEVQRLRVAGPGIRTNGDSTKTVYTVFPIGQACGKIYGFIRAIVSIVDENSLYLFFGRRLDGGLGFFALSVESLLDGTDLYFSEEDLILSLAPNLVSMEYWETVRHINPQGLADARESVYQVMMQATPRFEGTGWIVDVDVMVRSCISHHFVWDFGDEGDRFGDSDASTA